MTDVLKIALKYDSGTILISGISKVPFSTFDSRMVVLGQGVVLSKYYRLFNTE
jgi:hypothetical protein